jgi:hypothetical protein
MSRGNQREVDRAKRQAKDASKNQATREGTPMQRNQDDAAKLQAKIAAKAAKEAAEREQQQGAAGGAAPVVVRKKVPKKEDAALDDLLNAGLGKAKKK